MSTIKNMIKYNTNFKSGKYNSINEFIDNLSGYTKNDQIIIHNTILNILNKKEVTNDEEIILINIVNKLQNNINANKISTIIFLMSEVYNNLFTRNNNLDNLKNVLRSIDNPLIKSNLDSFERGLSSSNSVNIKNLNKSKYYTAVSDGSTATIVGYYQDKDGYIDVLMYGKEKTKIKNKYKSYLEGIPLDKMKDYYRESNTVNTSNKEKSERFSLTKSVSGKDPKIQRNGNDYKYIMKNKNGEKINEKNYPVIYTTLEQNSTGKYILKDKLKPLNAMNANNKKNKT
jgi:hypothetical protein